MTCFHFLLIHSVTSFSYQIVTKTVHNSIQPGELIPVSRFESGQHVLELTMSTENQFTSTSWHHLQGKGEISGMLTFPLANQSALITDRKSGATWMTGD